MTTSRSVLVLGATGSIGRAAVTALLRRGWAVTCLVRPPAEGGDVRRGLPAEARIRPGTPDSADAVRREGFAGERFDAVLSCMASRTGAPKDAWAVDYQANLHALRAAEAAEVRHFVLLSAICVQKPRLAFQHAKLAFEEALRASALDHSVVRATAFFKSISGQVERVRDGKPFLVFGDGRLNACKPIADDDLADFLVDCLERPEFRNRTLPVGGPGPAVTPRDQGELLFRLAGREPRFRRIPVSLLNGVVGALGLAGRIFPPLAPKAELARIARYYATESMLVWDEDAGRYDAEATPGYGERTLEDYYRRLLRGEIRDERGEHAIL